VIGVDDASDSVAVFLDSKDERLESLSRLSLGFGMEDLRVVVEVVLGLGRVSIGVKLKMKPDG
jgi:hypothetical protein